MRTARSSSRPGGCPPAPPPEQTHLEQTPHWADPPPPAARHAGIAHPPTARHAGIAHPPAARHAGISPAMHAGIPPPPPWTEWQTGVKILPCPKLLLRAVNIHLSSLVIYGWRLDTYNIFQIQETFKSQTTLLLLLLCVCVCYKFLHVGVKFFYLNCTALLYPRSCWNVKPQEPKTDL